jgi:hypothetical protein
MWTQLGTQHAASLRLPVTVSRRYTGSTVLVRTYCTTDHFTGRSPNSSTSPRLPVQQERIVYLNSTQYHIHTDTILVLASWRSLPAAISVLPTSLPLSLVLAPDPDRILVDPLKPRSQKLWRTLRLMQGQRSCPPLESRLGRTVRAMRRKGQPIAQCDTFALTTACRCVRFACRKSTAVMFSAYSQMLLQS